MIFLNYKYLKHLIFLGVYLLIFINLVYSQSRRDDIEDYDSEAPKLIAELIYSFMEGVQEKTKEISEKELSDKEITGMSKFKDQFLNSDSVKISDINIFLSDTNNGWSNNGYRLFQQYEKNYIAEANNHKKLFKVLEIPEKFRKVSFSFNGAIIEILIENHSQDILDRYNISNKKHFNEIEINNSRNPEKSKNNINFLSWWSITLYSIIIVLIALLIYIIDLRINADDKVNEQKIEIKKLIHEIQRLENNILKETRKFEEPKRITNSFGDIDHYKKNVAPYLENEKDINIDKKSAEAIKEDNIISKEEVIDKVNVNKKKYFRFPNDDGSFDMYDGQSTPETRSFYEIEFSETLGVLRFRSNNSDKVILQDIYKRLFPVADLVEDSNVDSPTKIQIIENGKVELVNNKWIIIEKIKVKLL
jgi:hypothetical protein